MKLVLISPHEAPSQLELAREVQFAANDEDSCVMLLERNFKRSHKHHLSVQSKGLGYSVQSVLGLGLLLVLKVR